MESGARRVRVLGAWRAGGDDAGDPVSRGARTQGRVRALYRGSTPGPASGPPAGGCERGGGVRRGNSRGKSILAHQPQQPHGQQTQNPLAGRSRHRGLLGAAGRATGRVHQPTSSQLRRSLQPAPSSPQALRLHASCRRRCCSRGGARRRAWHAATHEASPRRSGDGARCRGGPRRIDAPAAPSAAPRGWEACRSDGTYATMRTSRPRGRAPHRRGRASPC
jgi:hypothetical protein